MMLVTGEVRAETNSAAMFMGEASCSSSSCHGGAGEKRDQCFVWSKRDFHSRSYATLTMARSTRIAESLKISDPTSSGRCTVCHAPFRDVPAAELSKAIDPTLGVSCESCHGRAENWLRSHTRTDYTHQDRVHAGMQDLENLYARANACVACHQNVDADLLQAGHPELIFELDGQLVTEPRHWREKVDWSGPRTWLVGQAVALREMSWQVAGEVRGGSPSPRPSPPGEGEVAAAPGHISNDGSNFSVSTEVLERINDRWAALVWLMQTVGTLNAALPAGASVTLEPSAANAERAQKWADEVARAAATNTSPWTEGMTRQCLRVLAGTAEDFRQKSVSRAAQGRRAERLVLALDRLVMGLNDAEAKRLDEPLNRLFKDAQSLPDFEPERFAGNLEAFRKEIAEK